MEALQMAELRGMKELGARLNEIHDKAGVSYQSIAEETEVSRSYVSSLANHGAAPISTENQARLWEWVDRWDVSQGLRPAAAEGVKTAPELIQTRDLLNALGFCEFCVKHREIGVVMGMPGTGKTTVAGIMQRKLPKAIKIEAWLSMRLGDLLDEIGAGLGLDLSGTLTSKTRKIINALKRSPDTVILIDEAE